MAFEILGPIVIGAIAGIIDLYFMIKDETGDAKKVLGHGFGAFVPILIFSFLVFNLDFVRGFLPVSGWFTSDYFIITAVVLVLAIWIHAKSAVFGRGPGSHVTWLHSLLVALIVGLGPIIWPFIQPYIPFKTGLGQEAAAPSY